ncbi:hypothetical protein [Stigmatella aurantiaca]|uniref:Uncharacterized protein n=1 Tax=Stigmatella aurantiaca (strain DW4/3-1) TaxID=378806 RepID=E3FED8_STIAD|nr:hypothetical protein [Stigmatella aurantiaca]ADO73908.1 uncharacterized protein STAUR_6151 [Stigmatella aurantiaca DW4/3-1]
MKEKKLLFLLLTLAATVASAGAKANYEVSVYLANPTYGSAGGTIAAAQNSADTRQSILCSITVNASNPAAPTRNLTCQAVDALGNLGWCILSNPPQAMVDLITSLNDTSYLGFQWNKSNSVCTQLTVERSSLQAPRGGTSLSTATRTAAPSVSPMADALEQK